MRLRRMSRPACHDEYIGLLGALAACSVLKASIGDGIMPSYYHFTAHAIMTRRPQQAKKTLMPRYRDARRAKMFRQKARRAPTSLPLSPLATT